MTSIIEHLQNQIGELLGPLADVISALDDAEDKTTPQCKELEKNYLSLVIQLQSSAYEAECIGIGNVLGWLSDNVEHIFQADKIEVDSSIYELLTQWPFCLTVCLSDSELVGELLALLKNPAWPSALSSELESKLLSELSQVSDDIDNVGETIEVDEDINFHSDVFSVIYTELIDCLAELEANKSIFLEKHTTEYTQNIEFITYRETIERIHSVFEMTELIGAQQILEYLLKNIDEMAKQCFSCDEASYHVIDQWPKCLLDYLKDPINDNIVSGLIKLFMSDTLFFPITEKDSDNIVEALLTPNNDLPEDEPRQTQATLEDVTLDIADDIPIALYETFLRESPLHIAAISNDVQQLMVGSNGSSLRSLQNNTHTLKGAAATIGINGITNLCHHMEDIVEYFGDNGIAINQQAFDLLLETADCLEAISEYLQGIGEAPDNILAILQSLLDCANKMSLSDTQTIPDMTEDVPVLSDNKEQAVNGNEITEEKNISMESASNLVKNTPTLRIETETVEKLIRQVRENFVLNGHMRERQYFALTQASILSEKSNLLQEKVLNLEALVDTKGTPIFSVMSSNKEQDTEKIHSEDGVFDPLELDQYNELHTHIRQFSETVADVKEVAALIQDSLFSFKNTLQQQDSVNRDIQNHLMSSRMAKVQSIKSRLERCVRNTCRLTDKRADLLVEGEDILIDMDVLNAVVDPLMHILRNAVDHGIEAPNERKIKSKDEIGRILLSFKRTGNSVVIQCKDDGSGLDCEKIKHIALEKGLLSHDADYSGDEIEKLIFMPGFSTNETVSKISGRGVGMDVVYQNIANMGGTIDIQSEPGKSLSLSIFIPITLLSVNVAIIKYEGMRLAIPSNQIEKILFTKAGKLSVVGEKTIYHIDKNRYPVFNFSQLIFSDVKSQSTDNLFQKPALLIRGIEHTNCVFVDEIVECRDIVIKPLSKHLPEISGISGSTIMADGSIIPVLDMNQLLLQTTAVSSVQSVNTTMATSVTNSNTTKVLITEDSISVRRSLQELIKDAGYEVRTAQDGMEAITIMEDWLPNIILSDLEMPGMNGLELTAYIRSNQKTKSLPVIMITSRHTKKHHLQAKKAGVSQYLTKPYSDVQLLEAIENLVESHHVRQ